MTLSHPTVNIDTKSSITSVAANAANISHCLRISIGAKKITEYCGLKVARPKQTPVNKGLFLHQKYMKPHMSARRKITACPILKA